MKRSVDNRTETGKSCPKILGLFQKRIDGDDALLKLGRLRFSQAGLGTEFYAETPGELEYLLQFRPGVKTPAAVHLSRRLNILNRDDRSNIADFAAKAAERIFGLVVHDQVETATHQNDYVGALRELDSMLQAKNGPLLFIEYASGLDTKLFVNLFRRIAGLENVSACIDTGHVGIWKTREVFSKMHPGRDICGIRTDDPDLRDLMDDISSSVDRALPETVHVVRELSAIGKPVHLHLHDGHPLSHGGISGVADHMSFLETIPLPFEFRGKRSVDLMYGLSGLSAILRAALEFLAPERISLSLEIHPGNGRIPLEDASCLFDHWRDRTNAEKMNCWLIVLSRNKKLLEEACRQFYNNRRQRTDETA